MKALQEAQAGSSGSGSILTELASAFATVNNSVTGGISSIISSIGGLFS